MPRSRTAPRPTATLDPEPDPVLEFLRLMWAVDHELHRVSKAMIGRLGLTAPQRLAVRFVGRQPGLTPGHLAELLHLDPGTVSGIVKRLESSGLLNRVRSGGDTRRMHLTLTAKGQTLNRRKRGTVEAAVRRTLAGLSSADLAAASRLLRRLAAHLADESAA
jgi:MarR family transcriptional regulator, organic hydroperoxide resistance regulator